jgi:peroxiredoxin
VRLGYKNVRQFPWGYQGWQALKDPVSHKALAPEGPLEGQFFPKCRLAVLRAGKDILYLGLSPGSRYFSISEISGDYVLIEVYNEMCTLCLKELPNINRLFKLLDADGELRQRVKILGLGAGSTRRSVAGFRKKTGYDFPLFADEKWHIFGLLGKPILPVLYLMEKDGVNGLRILLRHEGGIGNPEDFLVHLKRRIDQEDAPKKDNTKP